jgi:hypothetical protein
VTQNALSLSFRAWWVPVLVATVASAALAIGADTGDLRFFVHTADDAQGATALTVATVLGLAAPAHAARRLAGALAVMAVRLALDPVRYPWYWLALETLALVGAVEILTGERVGLRQAERLSSNSARAPALHPRRP